ncbi:MAG: hypothetical protein ACYSUI_14635 [Planctomycetota bacterium]
MLSPLIDALEQRDFGVVYESERSLMRLTGRTFEYDAPGWREWLAQTEDPFADAGRLDEVLSPPPKGWWRESLENTRRAWASFKPKRKTPRDEQARESENQGPPSTSGTESR